MSATVVNPLSLLRPKRKPLGMSAILLPFEHSGEVDWLGFRAVDRPGRYGGSFDNRTRFLREIVAGIRAEAPGLRIAVRVSAADGLPYRGGAEGVGEPASLPGASYPYAFGGDGTGLGVDLTEPRAFVDLLESLDIRRV